MTRPNFFILGAPKCGTTSLADWLSQHPAVYMSPAKEPHYYSPDFPVSTPLDDAGYTALFAGATDQHTAVGEASVWYLLSQEAVPALLKDSPNARFIVMVRNPIEMAPSLHSQMLFNGDENENDFEHAWPLQFARERGETPLPKNCRALALLQYQRACSLGAQLERLYRHVDPERVLVLFLEDMARDPMDCWRRTLKFLKLPCWEHVEFIVRNQAKDRRFPHIQSARRTYLRWQQRYRFRPLGLGIFRILNQIGIRPLERPPLSDEMRSCLAEAFAEDIRLLAELSGRDLNHWLQIDP